MSSIESQIDPLDTSHNLSDSEKRGTDAGEYDYHERLTGSKHAMKSIMDSSQSEESSPTDSTANNKAETNENVKTQSTTVERWKWRGKLSMKFMSVYLKIFCLFLGILSVYWGSLFHRERRYGNMKMLVVSEDEPFYVNDSRVEPLLGNAFLDMIRHNETVVSLADWDVVPVSNIKESAEKHNNTVEEEIIRKIHHQKYWSGVYIKPNVTNLLYQSLASADYSIVSNGQISALIDVIYESGRHYSALSQYVVKHLNTIQDVWINYYAPSNVQSVLVTDFLTAAERAQLLSSNNTISLLTAKPTFNFIDERPSPSPAVLGPSELGLIYAQIFSFHQFNFSLEIHSYLRTRLRFRHYIIYRLLSSQVNCLVLSLVYSLTTIAFQIPVNGAFGNSGFLVLWMIMYLFISASGGINENVVSIILAFDKKVLLAPWMIFNIVINISPTFAPFVLLPGFYKYGYALPMLNTYEALKVVFFDTWKGHLGLNLGILLIWIVATNILLVWNVKWSHERTKKLTAAKESEREEKLQPKKSIGKQD